MQFEQIETESHASVATLARNDGGGLDRYEKTIKQYGDFTVLCEIAVLLYPLIFILYDKQEARGENEEARADHTSGFTAHGLRPCLDALSRERRVRLLLRVLRLF